MKLARRFWAVLLIVCAATTASAAPGTTSATSKSYPDPARFEKSIRAFEAKDNQGTPAPGGIVCVGSSSMAFWNATVQQDLAPLPVIPRGFGGSTMNDALFFADRVVTRYRPKAVVLYEGDNDVAAGIAPEKIRETFEAFTSTVHKALPDAHIYVISIKLSPVRATLWPKILETNRLIQAACGKDKRLVYVSIVEAMMGSDGKVREDLFRTDKLHMNPKGYSIWRDKLRPILMGAESVAKQG